MKVFDYIGFFGPQILFLVSLVALYSQKTFLIVYVIAMGFNSLLNFAIKALVKQPRPNGDLNVFNGKRHRPRILSDIYGMPSGHSQQVFLSTVFVYLVLKNNKLTFFYFILSLLTLTQRVNYKNHTVMQVIVGSCVGAIVAYLAYIMAKLYDSSTKRTVRYM